VDLDDLAQSISALSDHAVTQRLTQLLLDLKQDDWTVLYLLVALAAGFVIGRYRAYVAYAFQNRGEELPSRVALTHFCPAEEIQWDWSSTLARGPSGL